MSKSNQENNNLVEKISLLEKIAYGFGDVGCAFSNILALSYITFFYTDALGLNAAIIGSIIMFSKLADGISDILAGYVVDRTKSKYGKTRVWLLRMAVPLGICLVLTFSVPAGSSFMQYIYIAITYNLINTVCYTLVNVPYGTLNSLLTRDQSQRMVINTFRMTMAQVGTLIVSMCTIPFVNLVGGTSQQKSWIIVACVYGAIATVMILFCFFNTKERVTVVEEMLQDKLSLAQSFKLALKNKYWIILTINMLLIVVGGVLPNTAATYYMKYILGNENIVAVITSISYVPSLVLNPCLPLITKRIGKRNVALMGGLFGVVGHIMIFISPVSYGWLIFCSFIKGIGTVMVYGTMFAMIADTIEYGEWKTGTRVEGVLYATSSFGTKVGSGIGSALVLFILGRGGYDGAAATQTATALSMIKAAYLYIPVIILAVIPILFWAYKLDRIYPQIIKELMEREVKSKS